MHFVEIDCSYFIESFEVAMDKSALIQVMAWRWTMDDMVQ